MGLNSFLVTELKKLKFGNLDLWNDIKRIRKDYPNIWRLIQLIGDYPKDDKKYYPHIVRQHALIRQIVIYLRDDKKYLIDKIDLKAKDIIEKSNTNFNEGGIENDLFSQLKKPIPNDNIDKLNITIGGEVSKNGIDNVYHGKILRPFFKRIMRNYSNEFEFFYIRDYDTIIRKWTLDRLQIKLSEFFEKENVVIKNASNYFWVTNAEFFANGLNSNFTEIYYSLGFERKKEDMNEIFIVFRIDVSEEDIIYKTSIFADGVGDLFRPQIRKDKWGETVNALSLNHGVPEGLLKEKQIKSNFELGILKNIMPIEDDKKFYSDLLIKSFEDFRNNW